MTEHDASKRLAMAFEVGKTPMQIFPALLFKEEVYREIFQSC